MRDISQIIVEAVKERTGVVEEIYSTNRKQNLVAARIMATGLLMEMTTKTEEDIGTLLCKNKSTVHYYASRFYNMYRFESGFKFTYDTVRNDVLKKIADQL